MPKDSNTKPLNGMVQVDGTYVGGRIRIVIMIRKLKTHKAVQQLTKTPVVGLFEQNGLVLTFVDHSTEAETLHQIIDNNVSNDAIIVTDAYKSYVGLNKK